MNLTEMWDGPPVLVRLAAWIALLNLIPTVIGVFVLTKRAIFATTRSAMRSTPTEGGRTGRGLPDRSSAASGAQTASAVVVVALCVFDWWHQAYLVPADERATIPGLVWLLMANEHMVGISLAAVPVVGGVVWWAVSRVRRRDAEAAA